MKGGFIVKSNNQFLIKSHKNKTLGSFSSYSQALHRLKQIEYFKHVKAGRITKSSKFTR